jgi:hypothetical protein
LLDVAGINEPAKSLFDALGETVRE